MREIKFRCYRSDTEIMSEPLTLREWIEASVEVALHYGSSIKEKYMDAAIWEQFTGLHDKHGKEIYENDLVRVTDHPTGIDSMAQTVVEFHEGAFVCGYNRIRLSDYGSQWIEVLGHIHEPHRQEQKS